jgi:L-rhamnose mutarotase
MIRKAFVMSVDAKYEDEYRRRHNPIWPELESTLKAYGVSNYSIFLNTESHSLFAYAEIEDEAQWLAIGQTEICQKWWSYMKDVMPSNSDNSPVSQELREMFHLI